MWLKQCLSTGATGGAGASYPSGAPEMCNVVLFVIVLFSIWPLCCLSFDLPLLITPLVSSNFSYRGSTM